MAMHRQDRRHVREKREFFGRGLVVRGFEGVGGVHGYVCILNDSI